MAARLQTMIASLRRRLTDESGHVGVLMAMALFVVVGMLMMTWNTAQLSKEKMRLQNAADSAALGFCVWQARGMNAVQNINDEMYVALWVADKLIAVAVGVEAVATALEVCERIPFVGPAFAVASNILHILALLTGGTSGLLASRICPWILKPLSYFYAYGSAALGWWGAQQLADKNGASPVGGLSWKVNDKWSLGFFAVGISFPIRDTALLPIEQKEDKNGPWQHKDWSKTFTLTKYKIYKNLHKLFGTGKEWSFKPWVSKTEKDEKSKKEVPQTPGPSIWIAYKSAGRIETLPLGQWTKKTSDFRDKVHAMPMFAVAAAQCISGDVVAHSKKPKSGEINQRRAGFGTGATAKLIPVATALKALNETLGKVVGAAIYH